MLVTITFTVNGQAHTCGVNPGLSLLELLREKGFTSVKSGCEVGECGACTVLMDGTPVNTCLTLAVWADGKTLRTVEGEVCCGTLSRVQQAYVAAGATQCGFCTPGLVMTTTAFVEKYQGQSPSREAIRKAHAGHLCRCTGYDVIVRAVEIAMDDDHSQECACRNAAGA